jgi:hypothetical protein
MYIFAFIQLTKNVANKPKRSYMHETTDYEGGSDGVCRQGKKKAGGGMDGGRDAAVEWLAEQRASRGDKSVVFSRETLRQVCGYIDSSMRTHIVAQSVPTRLTRRSEICGQFDGRVPGRPLLLCVLGECFDVSAGTCAASVFVLLYQ